MTSIGAGGSPGVKEGARDGKSKRANKWLSGPRKALVDLLSAPIDIGLDSDGEGAHEDEPITPGLREEEGISSGAPIDHRGNRRVFAEIVKMWLGRSLF